MEFPLIPSELSVRNLLPFRSGPVLTPRQEKPNTLLCFAPWVLRLFLHIRQLKQDLIGLPEPPFSWLISPRVQRQLKPPHILPLAHALQYSLLSDGEGVEASITSLASCYSGGYVAGSLLACAGVAHPHTVRVCVWGGAVISTVK